MKRAMYQTVDDASDLWCPFGGEDRQCDASCPLLIYVPDHGPSCSFAVLAWMAVADIEYPAGE